MTIFEISRDLFKPELKRFIHYSLIMEALLVYSKTHEYARDSLNLIRKTLEDYQYDCNRFAVCFNGGKDCTVLLHLVHSVLVSSPSFISGTQLKTVLIRSTDNFPEIDEFVRQSTIRYNLKLLEFDGPCYKIALQNLKTSEDGHQLDALFMGTRSSDIDYPLQSVQRTDPSWPDYLRVNPVLNWSYANIWSFLLDLRVPYCSLYDMGYTSLGSRNNTVLNPRLMYTTETGETQYLPAYKLDDPSAERSGRSK